MVTTIAVYNYPTIIISPYKFKFQQKFALPGEFFEKGDFFSDNPVSVNVNGENVPKKLEF